MEKYPRGSRGSPAKGVVCDKCSEGSNPSFSAKRSLIRTQFGLDFFSFGNEIWFEHLGRSPLMDLL